MIPKWIYVYISVDRLQVTSDNIKTILKHNTNIQYIYYILVYID